VEYRFSSPESGVTFECKKDDAAYKACASPFIDDWQGETAHVLSVRAVRGGLPGPATNATFTVDTVKPVVTLTSADDQDADNDGLADQPFRTPDFVVDIDLSDATSGVDWDKLDAYFQSDSDAVKHKAVPTRPHTQGHVQVGGDSLAAPPGPGTFTVTAYDLAGNATVVKLRLIIVSGQPTIIENNKLTLFTDAPTVEVPFEATDDVLKYPQGEMEFECYRKGWDGTVKGDPKKAKIITDRDTGRSKGFCTFADVPEGTYKVTVRGWDPVKKEAIAEGDLVVDRTAPKIDLVNPDDADKDGDGVADKRFRPSFFDVFTEISDLESGIDPSGTSCVAKVVNKGAIKGNVTINNANRVTCSFGGLPDGDVDVEITAKNYVGTVTIVKRTFTVDLTPPTVDFADPGDLDTDGDGFSDQRVRAARLGYHVWVSDSRIGVDPNSGACTAKNRKRGMVNGNVTINNGTLRCTFDGLPDGDTDIEISAADLFGNKKSLTTAVTIDSQASPDPVITINNPSQGQSIPQGGQIYAGYLITGAGPYAVKCLIDNVVVSTNCPSGTALSTAGLTTGPHLFQISAQDDFGNYGAERTFSIVPSGGGQACIAIYPPPPGCPGGPPLGGGGGPVIIVP
jgi:hypothetical protein